MVMVMMVMVANNVAHGGQRGAHRLEHNWWPKVAARSIIITLNVGISSLDVGNTNWWPKVATISINLNISITIAPHHHYYQY